MFIDDAMEASMGSALKRMGLVPRARLEMIISESPPPPSFAGAISRDGGPVRVIAEVKRMSPSAGDIDRDVRVAGRVREYEAGGASAVSVITCEYRFGGSLADLAEARLACGMPLLRKDFVSHEYQVLEARAHGASAVLLIADALPVKRLGRLVRYARELGMDALVESHTGAGVRRAAAAGARIFGINNRDLATLEVDVETTARLLPTITDGATVVSESGIRTAADAARIAELGVDALLIGEALMRAEDPRRALGEFACAGGQRVSPGEVDESCG